MRYAAFVMWLVCRNIHKGFFVSIFAFLFLTIKAVECQFYGVEIIFSCRDFNFGSLKIRNLMSFWVIIVTILAEYPS